jgi:hypothetical protein
LYFAYTYFKSPEKHRVGPVWSSWSGHDPTRRGRTYQLLGLQILVPMWSGFGGRVGGLHARHCSSFALESGAYHRRDWLPCTWRSFQAMRGMGLAQVT